MPIDYETTPIIFYKFVCENPEIKSYYVGHTTNFNRRKIEHKSRCYNKNAKHYNLKIYEIIRENGGWDNWTMIEISSQICLNKSDACKIEQYYIEELQANMNMLNAIYNKEKWDLINKEIISKYQKKWYLEHKQHISETHKRYYIKNKEYFSKKNKDWYLKNKERLSKQNKEYYLDTKEQKLIKYNCECGGIYCISAKSRHLKTKKHLESLKITL